MLRGIRESLRPFTDDRGRAFDHTHNTAEALANDEPYDEEDDLWSTFLDADHDIAIPMLALAVLPVVIVAAVLRLPGWLVVVVVIAAVVVVAVLHRRFLLTPCLCSRGYECIQQAVRRGRCAACGYALCGLTEDDDGMIACPECCAAWRSDRLRATEAPGDAAERRFVRARLGAVLQTPRATPYLDSRGRHASLVLYRPARNHIDNYAARCHRAAESIYTTVSGKGAWMSATLIAVGIGLFLFMLWYGALDPLGTPPWVYALIPAMALALFAGFLFRRGDLLVKRVTIEQATLAQGLCPSCWELLEGIPPDSDGCTMCPECGSSWRLPEPLTPPAFAPAPAPHSRSSPARPETSR